jgi:PAS domain S-box-containing protein
MKLSTRLTIAMVALALVTATAVGLLTYRMAYAQLMSTATSVRDTALLGGLAVVIGAIALAVIISRSLTRPLVQMTRAVAGFARNEPIALPTSGGREIAMLAGAFTRMATEARERAVALDREIEERRRIFDAAPDLIVVTDRRGRFVRVSPSSDRILGYRPEDLICRSPAEFVYHSDLESTREQMRSMRQGEHMRNFETRCVHKDGRVVTLAWTGVWLENGQQYFFIGRDMTESKKAQQALLESEQMGRGIVATSLDAFVQLDETGHVRDWNRQAEAIFGWSRAEAMGQPVESLYLPPGYRPRYLELAERMNQSDAGEMTGERFDFEAVRRDGRKIKMEVSITSLRRRNGLLFNFFLRDLTQKIATEEQLRHAQKMESVGQLTGGIAHDFNNMLTVITGTIDILAEAVADKPQLAAIAKLISEAADRGAELTGHLLAFARKQPLQPREIDVNTLLVESAKLMWPTLGEQIEIEPMLADDVWPALVDPNQLTSALLNLAINARDAMPNGGKLILETSNVVLDQSFAKTSSDAQPGSYVMIAVSDTGSGIPEAIRERVFEPFFSTKGVGKGSGLGLSMVYGFVKQSGGHIRLYSEEGHGTTVKLYLPRASKVSTPFDDALPASRIEGGDETILVVEDDALGRTYVDSQLRSLGYQTLTAANATEALAAADGGATFDLLFTDVIMPGPMNGRQLAEEMSKRRSPLKVLFTSGYAENAMIHQGRLDPGVLLLTKPYRKLDLAQMVRLALGDAGTYARRDARGARAS